MNRWYGMNDEILFYLNHAYQEVSGHVANAPKYRPTTESDRRAKAKAVAKRHKRNKNKKTHR